jgi:hypothetical protein
MPERPPIQIFPNLTTPEKPKKYMFGAAHPPKYLEKK